MFVQYYLSHIFNIRHDNNIHVHEAGLFLIENQQPIYKFG